MQPRVNEVPGLSCPLCETAQAARILRSRNGYDILRCMNCSLVFTDDRTAPSASRLYPHFDQSGTAFAKGAGSALKIFLHQRESFIRSLKPSGRLLDFGCGNGAFAQHMSTAGFDAVGVEPFSLGATHTADRLKLIRAPFEQVAGELGSFDVITLWHVLEHLRQPVEVLQRLATHLSPGGLIVISVPNFGSLQRTAFQGGWFHLDPPRHVIHFELSLLEECVRRAGLVPAAEKRFLPEYGCSGWIQSALNAILPHKNYLYELVKDRGALAGMSSLSSALHFVASLVLTPPLLAMSLPVEALASTARKGAALTLAVRRSA
jgi:2-polyprenyl-3-methyl-5-hydroxy-6-metoxy-1,4-benzoquinol methylase